MLIGVTGPSAFGQHVVDVVENHYNSDVVFLYHNNHQNLRDWTRKCTGVILLGGPDVHPTMYGMDVQNHSNLTSFDPKRDLREMTVISEALNNNVPILGICRGHQMLGVYHGAKLVQDISRSETCHNPWVNGIKQEMTDPAHSIHILKPSAWDGMHGGLVNSAHHQAVSAKGLSDEITIEATAKLDDKNSIVEAMSGPGWFSVQWHPECDYITNDISMTVWDRFGDMMR